MRKVCYCKREEGKKRIYANILEISLFINNKNGKNVQSNKFVDKLFPKKNLINYIKQTHNNVLIERDKKKSHNIINWIPSSLSSSAITTQQYPNNYSMVNVII